MILLVIDTLRADHVGCYGYERETTPGIDRIAASGIRYENAFTTAPWTLPAFGSILTSSYPWEHGAVNDYLALRRDLPTLARTLADHGYETAAFVSHIYTSRTYGFAEGFHRFEDFRIGEEYRFDQGREPRAEVVIRAALDWLGARKSTKPFFLWIHLFDPHWEYDAPEPYRTLFDGEYAGHMDGSYESIAPFFSPDSAPAPRDLHHLVALYDGEIQYADAWVDTLVRALREGGEWERTAMIVTADHGEEFNDHGSMGHSFTFYDEVLRVPLVLRRPGGQHAGSIVEKPVSLLDIFPTVMDLTGTPPPRGLGGNRLPGPSADETISRDLLAGTIREGRYGRSLLRGTTKLIWEGGAFSLFDRAEDPCEVKNLYGTEGAGTIDLVDGMIASSGGSGWTVEWPETPGDAHRYEGSVEPSGVVVEILPLSGATFHLEATNNRSFRFSALTAEAGGVRFRVVSPDAPIRFHLSIDGKEDPDLLYIGRDLFHPPSASFGLDPTRSPEGALSSPPAPPRSLPHMQVSKGDDPPPPPAIDLTAAEEERLRALGYFR